jgi:hypothetical protein
LLLSVDLSWFESDEALERRRETRSVLGTLVDATQGTKHLGRLVLGRLRAGEQFRCEREVSATFRGSTETKPEVTRELRIVFLVRRRQCVQLGFESGCSIALRCESLGILEQPLVPWVFVEKLQAQLQPLFEATDALESQRARALDFPKRCRILVPPGPSLEHVEQELPLTGS